MKVALVTGATRGIGLAILEKFVSEGIFVIGTYNSSSIKADEIIKKMGSDKVEFHQFSAGDLLSHRRLLAAINRKIDILVNNAGVGSKTVEHITSDKYQQDLELLRVNSLGPLWLCEAFIEKIRESNSAGKIINISSVGGGIFHFPGFRLADGMSKAALTFMTKQMAAELSQENIDIFAVCPGATETDMFEASTLAAMSAAERSQFVASLPKKRMIDPVEIANLVYFLTSKESTVLHGAVLDASLGLGSNPRLLS